MELNGHRQYQYRSRAGRLAFFLDSASYYAALAGLIPRAKRRILIVGWSFDDRIQLCPEDGNGPTVGDLLISAADERPAPAGGALYLEAPPPSFRRISISHPPSGPESADDGTSRCTIFRRSRPSPPVMKNMSFSMTFSPLPVASISAPAAGTVPDHRARNSARLTPEGDAYGPYHDTQALFSGPAVRDLFRLSESELPLAAPWGPAEGVLWPEGLEPDAENAETAPLGHPLLCGPGPARQQPDP